MPATTQPVSDLLELLAIPASSGEEAGVAAHLKRKLLELGVPEGNIATDSANRKSEIGGSTGNLIVRLDGHGRGERRMFSAHMDTVPDCIGAKPRVDGELIVNDAAGKALGGDNRTGCTVLLQVAKALQQRKGDHVPTTLVWLVQEEIGLVGARYLNVELLGSPRPARCYNFDGGNTAEVVRKVIGTERIHIEIEGLAAHAGAHPERGVNAALVAAHALSELDRNGWHGKITKSEGTGSANLGVLKGGQGSNVMMPALYALAEARSHDRAFRQQIIATWKDAFTRAAGQVRNKAGQSAKVSFRPGPWYDACDIPEEAPVVQTALEALRKHGVEAQPASNDGGMDTNWLTAHGIPAVTLGCGQQHVHTPAERIDLHTFELACRVALDLALA